MRPRGSAAAVARRAAAGAAARRTAAAALLAALFVAPPARAQGGDYTPVVGSGSFNAAPILAPGSYRDTVLPEEYLYYAVRLQAGQRLHLVANSELSGADMAQLDVAFVQVNVASPVREPLLSGIEGDETFRGSDEEPADITSFEVGTVADQGDDVGGAWQGPGVYYFGVYAAYVGDRDPPPRAEIPFHFRLSVEGTPTPEPVATPVATPKPRPTATPSDAEPGASPALAAGVGLGGVVVGAFAGVALRRRRGAR
jgi:Ca-activated chloride channel family protein